MIGKGFQLPLALRRLRSCVIGLAAIVLLGGHSALAEGLFRPASAAEKRAVEARSAQATVQKSYRGVPMARSVSGTASRSFAFLSRLNGVPVMMKGGLLWLIGIPLPIILLLWLFGFLG